MKAAHALCYLWFNNLFTTNIEEGNANESGQKSLHNVLEEVDDQALTEVGRDTGQHAGAWEYKSK